MWNGTLATTIVAHYENSVDPIKRDYCARIRKAGRLVVYPEVLEQTDVVDLPDFHDKTICKHFIANLHLPFEPTFLETRPPEGVEAQKRLGWLIYREDDHLIIRTSLFTGKEIVLPFVDLRVSPTGCETRMDFELECLTAISGNSNSYPKTILHYALGLIVILTARGTPAEIGPETDYTRLNRQRVRNGKPALLDVRPVNWNVKRIIQPANPNQVGLGLYKVRAHLVRGHYKVTKHGSYWWNPFYRGVGPNPTDGRDHRVGLMAGERRRGRPRRRDGQARYQGEAF